MDQTNYATNNNKCMDGIYYLTHFSLFGSAESSANVLIGLGCTEFFCLCQTCLLSSLFFHQKTCLVRIMRTGSAKSASLSLGLTMKIKPKLWVKYPFH